jgi:hypothetical protein
MSTKIKGVVGESSIVLHYHGEAITIQAATDRLLFEELKDLIKSGDIEKLTNKFLDVKARIEKYTDKNFYIQDKRMYLKGEDKPIPDDIARMLLKVEASGEDFMPLVRFWKKLQSNPSQASIDQLFGFVTQNMIPLTELGDIVVEKGVKQKMGAPVGDLVDCHTGAVDNSIGMEVSMDRGMVDENPDQTCSHGLHVGAPEYVRNHYSSSIIVVCTVNPRDVVAVPKDYKNTKMRVCKYIVVGYSHKSDYKPVYKFKDFIINPTEELRGDMESLSLCEATTPAEDKVVKTSKAKILAKSDNKAVKKFNKNFNKMTGKQIIKFVFDTFGVQLPHNPKSKTAIVNKAAKIAADSLELNKK